MTPRDNAATAALATAQAQLELMKYHAEGSFPDGDVVELLAEALALAIDLRLAEIEDCDHALIADLTALRDEAQRFIEGWAG